MQNNLRAERAVLRLTQDELTRRIGVSRQTINAMEADKYLIYNILELKLAQVFGKPVKQLFGLEDSD